MADKDGLKIAKDYHVNEAFANQGGFYVKGANNLDWGMKKQYIALLTEHKVKLLCLRERVSSDISGVSPFST